MSRILLMVLFLVWLAWPGEQRWSVAEQWPWLVLFIGFYVFLVVLLGLWSRVLARRIDASNFQQSVRRFNHTMFAARLSVPAWFAVGVWKLGWGPLIQDGLGTKLAQMLPGVLIGTLPAFAAWMGLWWSQYPADRALREQNILRDWENDLPIHQPPAFASYFAMNLRLQVLFTVVPVLMWVAARDLMMMVWSSELLASAVAAAVVFIWVPKVLRRVLNTIPLPQSTLRQRLEMLCQRANVRFCDILLWRTQNNIGNAAVMGILPGMRYFLLSDVLVERMTDEEIEAVFAHELGHIVHRHMTWYALFFIVLILLLMEVTTGLCNAFPIINHSHAGIALMMMGGTGVFLLLFGALSRTCERQADVYAARTMEAIKGDQAAMSSESLLNPRQLAAVGTDHIETLAPAPKTYVGPYGAKVFAAALERVAFINNIPVDRAEPVAAAQGLKLQFGRLFDMLVDMANHWFHGSILGRMDYLRNLSTSPRLTFRFDRAMFALYGTLLFGLVIAGILCYAMNLVW